MENGEEYEYEIPIGYRFCPTDEELITYYLLTRILNHSLPSNDYVKEVDIYKHTPDELQEKYGTRREVEMYFLTKRTPISATATRPSRTVAKGGYWRASTQKKPVNDSNGKTIGYKTLFNYFLAKGNMSTWLMYEYIPQSGSAKVDEFVLCKIYNKRSEQKHTNAARREQPRRNMMQPQAPITYQVDDVVLAEPNVAPQAQPTFQVDDYVQSVQPQTLTHEYSLNNIECFTMEELCRMAGIVSSEEPNYVCDYQPPVPQQPACDIPTHDDLQFSRQYMEAQQQEPSSIILSDVDVEFAQELEAQLQEPSSETLSDLHVEFEQVLEAWTLKVAKQFESQWQEPAYDFSHDADLHRHKIRRLASA
ncbi:protein ATAF2-like [Morus notabilis]|uniref:protein ATAF2-like n=1 Tax=Morus notabilis TaxID=981085 RepID=UPI000CED76A5|nr:protein ATAF2-like [Morus notabilis]